MAAVSTRTPSCKEYQWRNHRDFENSNQPVLSVPESVRTNRRGNEGLQELFRQLAEQTTYY